MILRTLLGWDKEIFTLPICRKLTLRAESLGLLWLALVSQGFMDRNNVALPNSISEMEHDHVQMHLQWHPFPFLCSLQPPAASAAFPPHQNLILVAPTLIWLFLSLPEGGCGGGLSTTRVLKSRCVISPILSQKTILNFTKGWECENVGFPFSPLWVGFSKNMRGKDRGLIYVLVKPAHHFYPVLLSAVKTSFRLTRTCLLLRAGAAAQPLLDQASAKGIASAPDPCCQPKLRFRQLTLL